MRSELFCYFAGTTYPQTFQDCERTVLYFVHWGNIHCCIDQFVDRELEVSVYSAEFYHLSYVTQNWKLIQWYYFLIDSGSTTQWAWNQDGRCIPCRSVTVHADNYISVQYSILISIHSLSAELPFPRPHVVLPPATYPGSCSSCYMCWRIFFATSGCAHAELYLGTIKGGSQSQNPDIL